ncbi:histidine kinase famiy protein [Noviherbaspirillum sp. CPCC 100848]|uniref:histidine kinase n=1 Tax=Noviherbaspirillum album TaxID=3080276 RepID=A0ABU6J3Q2_9BURK|nr:histidine kinase famiy protein [Noviherbaspirillum sp. CPCC 100848]MEC4717839.1 histidine kinase famiy protein [Noviherbaspirillum sp. CPCC 100848]
MATGSNQEERAGKPLDTEDSTEAAGAPADGQLEGSSFNPLGNPGVKHWQASYIARPGLEERGNIFFAAVEMTRMPMLVTDPNQEDNPIVFVNRAFLDLTSYEEEQVLGRNCRLLQGPETNRDTVAEIRNALKEQRAVAVDILNYKADGTPFWNALFIGPIFDPDGKLLYYFASQLDITRRRVSEQSYLQAQKMEAIGQLTAGLAHDFNNLLQVISGNLEMAIDTLDAGSATHEAVERAQLAAGKASKLTQQLLTFARKQRLEPRRVNLNSLVVEFSEMLVRTLGEKVDLHLDLKPGLPSCTLDATHMEMALLNVLINARDAMPNGGKVVVATSVINDKDRLAAHHLEPGTYVVICVIDKGEGMTPEVARRATEPFFTTKGPGTGLGLAMVHGFVQQSHGRLEIESTAGEGTIIRMIFPVADRSAFEVSATRTTSPAGRLNWSPAAIMGRQTILVVDDSQDVRELAEVFLRSLGYRVLAAQSGEEALEMLERYGTVDLLFTDIIMPGGMNGLQLVERARARHPQMPVLLATGYMEELPRYGAESAALNILTKPYRQAELAERVRTMLEKITPPTAPGSFRHEG